jgi:hypothetical protein
MDLKQLTEAWTDNVRQPSSYLDEATERHRSSIAARPIAGLSKSFVDVRRPVIAAE